VRNARRSPLTAIAVAVVAVIGLGACTSQPSEKAVVKDVIEGLDGLTDTERTCMLDHVDNYSEDELKAIGEANETVDFSQPDAVDDQGTEALQKFVTDLNGCMGTS
jgi:hypothetical protein